MMEVRDMAAESRSFGYTSQGEAVRAYTLENSGGMRAVMIDYGATGPVGAEPPGRPDGRGAGL